MSNFWHEFFNAKVIEWDTQKKVVNNYYINNYYIHTENKVIQVTEQEFKKFIEKKKLELQ